MKGKTVVRAALLPSPAALREPGAGLMPAEGVLLLLSLGHPPAAFETAARSAPEGVTVLLADCYGVLGTAPDGGTRELMEAGRGREYGGVGGSGGSGVVAVALSGARADAPDAAGPAHLVIAAHGRPRPAGAPCLGGVAKATWRWDAAAGRFAATEGLHIALPPELRVAATAFTGEPEPALRALLEAVPPGCVPEALALFPCFMRGVNRYGRDGVEPETAARLAPGVPLFGMFCHGELGPPAGRALEPDPGTPCVLHSMTTVAAVLCRRACAGDAPA